MKTALIFLLFTTICFSQSEVNDLIQQGIEYHDAGQYDSAIATYKKALEIEPQSTMIYYELAFSYFKKGDYDKAIEHSDFVIDKNASHLLEAYLTKGSALDMKGKTKESIKLFEKALKKMGDDYLIYYNLALNHYKLQDLDEAEKNVIKAIEHNPDHTSSHLMLAHIHNFRGNTVQTLMAAYYFLFLEPNSSRSQEAYAMLQKKLGGNVSKDKNKPNAINITLAANNDTDFGAAEMMVALLEASKSLEENVNKTEDEMFVENTDSFFTMLGELNEKKKKNKDIWWNFYTPFFYNIAQTDHIETYCKLISQSSNGNSVQWLDANETRVADFEQWLENNL